MWAYILRLPFFFIVCLSSVDCSRYDLDQEAQKLFGEDLKGALKRFRRSYEYLQILEERQAKMGQELAESYTYMEAYYIPLIEQRIKEMLGIKDDDVTEGDAASPSKRKLRQRHLRQGEEDSHEATKSDVQLLDDYVSESRVLTVPDINSFANLGYEFAGKIIEGIISNLGGKIEDGDTNKMSAGQSDQHKVTNQGDFISTAHAAVEDKATEAQDQSFRGIKKSYQNRILAD